jgi:D-tyrosyl-tRNA(Tyr) deacylase
VGIEESDDEDAVSRIAAKVAVLRVFEDSAGRMNLSTGEAGGSMLVISQFTLFADVRKGRRPSFIRAARPDKGKRLYELFASLLVSHGYAVARGVFGAHMLVSLENDGPVTIILDSAEL